MSLPSCAGHEPVTERRTRTTMPGRRGFPYAAVTTAQRGCASLVTGFGEVASLALISGSTELLRAWIAETLGALADDDEHNARLRDTLRVFLQ